MKNTTTRKQPGDGIITEMMGWPIGAKPDFYRGVNAHLRDAGSVL